MQGGGRARGGPISGAAILTVQIFNCAGLLAPSIYRNDLDNRYPKTNCKFCEQTFLEYQLLPKNYVKLIFVVQYMTYCVKLTYSSCFLGVRQELTEVRRPLNRITCGKVRRLAVLDPHRLFQVFPGDMSSNY
jgi:hypothetical protein